MGHGRMNLFGSGGRVAWALLLLAGATTVANASTVTFDWISTSGPAATASVSLTSSLITTPTGFTVTLAQLNAAGQTAVGDISAFQVTFADGETMALANSTFSNSTGWSDDSTGHLTSTWNASRSVTNPSGTLQVSSVPYAGSSVAQTVLSTGTTQDYGYWQIRATPVPVPAALWLMVSGLSGLIAAGRRRRLPPDSALAGRLTLN
jgi:hypothetical protein